MELVGFNLEQPKVVTKMGPRLELEMLEALVALLVKHKDIFAWNHADMLRIDHTVTKHQLLVHLDARAVRYRRRSFNKEKYTTIVKEVDLLL